MSVWQENGDINQYLEENPDVDFWSILQGISSGLKHMHQKGVIHGDLRGGNILVSEDGVPMLSDFGLSKVSGQDSSVSKPSGTLRWMARELLEENPTASGSEVSARRSKASDIWSLAMTFLELLSGEHPFYDKRGEYSVMMAIVAGVLPEFPGVLHDHWLEFEQPLMEICAKCWAQDPSDRPDAETVLEELREPKLADRPECENGSEDSSLTPRAHPLEDELLESIEALSLSPSPTEDYIDVADFFPDANGGGGSSPESSVCDDYAESQSYSIINKENGQRSKAFDNPTMSYMTALNNHLSANNQPRKLLLRRDSIGPDHARTWLATISIDNDVIGSAAGMTYKSAQEEAAKQAYSILEKENIGSNVPYLPIFLNRLNVRGLRSQFHWHTVACGNWFKQVGGYVSVLYRSGVVVGQGKGISPRLAEGEAAKAVLLPALTHRGKESILI
ncbi:kinase-like domain-containing protein [Phellopilus nigrolimitatus]|nr:kinase-like domain-containing protein [Phellopilus nigrolimitatus]